MSGVSLQAADLFTCVRWPFTCSDIFNGHKQINMSSFSLTYAARFSLRDWIVLIKTELEFFLGNMLA